MTTPSSDSELDEAINKFALSATFWGLDKGLDRPSDMDSIEARSKAVGEFKAALLAWNEHRVNKAEERGVAWAIKEIDDMHMNTPSGERFESDRLFKGIKNSIRDRYKLHTGSDPAPSYPVHVELTRAESQGDE